MFVGISNKVSKGLTTEIPVEDVDVPVGKLHGNRPPPTRPAAVRLEEDRLETGDLPGTLASLEKTYNGLFPGEIFEFFFADSAFDLQYRSTSFLSIQ